MSETSLSDDEIKKICITAELLNERISSNNFEQYSMVKSRKLIYRREKWINASSAGDEKIFRNLLGFLKINEGEEFYFLEPNKNNIMASSPSWYSRLIKVLNKLSTNDSKYPSSINEKYPLPFEELFYELVDDVEHERNECILKRTKADIKEHINSNVLSDIQRPLLVRCCGLSSEIIFRQFEQFRDDSFGHSLFISTPDIDSNSTYKEFITTHRKEIIKYSMNSFPVLARLICLVVEQWIESTTELLCRLISDLDDIRSKFNIGVNANIKGINSLGSDYHHNGRNTWLVTFSNHKKVVYKPRSLSLDVTWMNFIRWLEINGAPPSVGTLIVYNRDNYGWMEWADHKLETPDLDSFFLRLGSLICLAHVLNANDLHYENVVAAGGIPHVVDLETIFHPRNGLMIEKEKLGEGHNEVRNSLRDTIAWTNLLPTWMITPQSDTFSIGALNPNEVEERSEDRFVNVNLDSMRLKKTKIRNEEAKSIPQCIKGTKWVNSATPLLCNGFQNMWDFITLFKEQIIKKGGPLETFRMNKIRVLLKPTQTYFFSLKRSLSAEFLVDGGVWSSQHHVLFRKLEKPFMDSTLAPIFLCELKSLSQLDMPYFTIHCDGKDLYSEDIKIINDAYSSSPYESVVNRIKNMNKSEMEYQIFLIEQSLYSLLEQNNSEPDSILHTTRSTKDNAFDLIEEASKIGEILLNSSIKREGRSWIGLAPIARSNHRQIYEMGVDLYSGSAGNALFFAALSSATNDNKWLKAVEVSLVNIIDILNDDALFFRLARTIGIGAGTGLGGVIYSLVKISHFLNDTKYYDMALLTCGKFTTEVIEKEKKLDLLSGMAGFLICLLSTVREKMTPWVFERAIHCGELLLARLNIEDVNNINLTGKDNEIELGIAHGLVGISFSLYQLGKVTGVDKYIKAAHSIISLEIEFVLNDGYYNSLPSDMEKYTRQELSCRWCRGYAGLLLANIYFKNTKLSSSPLLLDPQEYLLASEDNLCCGNFGRIEYLLATSLITKNEIMIDKVWQAVYHLLNRRVSKGSFSARVHDTVNSGFFTGITGIGYELLRVNKPEKFPNVLLWE